MTVKQFAERAEISLSLAYLLIAEGRVPHRRIGQKRQTRGDPDFRGGLPGVHGEHERLQDVRQGA